MVPHFVFLGVVLNKSTLRQDLRSRRAALPVDLRRLASQASVRWFFECPLPAGAMVALYAAVGDEMDTRPLASQLRARGFGVLYPRVLESKLGFFLPDEGFASGYAGVPEPVSQQAFDPDVVVVPLLGFDRSGGRLGQGGGFYDRALEALRAEKPVLAVGYAFGIQEVPACPVEPHDQSLDAIVTERELIAISR